ncbi:MAG: VWA domain-containing protein [Bacteroidetes bacterium]|nr:VWA domain-containing protein [Bacteroidota bacterium]
MSTNLTFYSSPSFTQVAPNFAPAFQWDMGSLVVVNGTATAPMTGTYTVTTTDAASVDATGRRFAGAKSETTTGPRDGKIGRFAVADSISVVYEEGYDSESYAETVENPYFNTVHEPLSTFSIDVDRASYTNHRRFVESGELPPKFSVRAEEFINYFDYTYAQPHGRDPFSILPEVTTCPWNPKNKLVRIALKGREVAAENVPPSNIVFLLDVSGSMADADKLPLLKQAMGMLTEKLREQDKVSIVVYAGAAGLVLPPTSGSNKQSIMGALDRLEAGGSTAGGEGIELAYATAKQNFIKGGNNRVILATDGDFNVGTSDETGLEKLIVEKREEGVFLSVLGFGEGNLQDSKMELLADKGNGNYNYIDSDREAHKVLVREFGGTLYTIAKDVKIQVEFNPAKVQSYRLVGYENRKLRNEDFANDKIDAGELGAGHTVTALYEVVPAESGWSSQSQDLKYQTKVLSSAAAGKELLTVKLRYKDPDGSVSKLLTETLIDDGRNIAQTTNDFRWAVAVAEYALILRESEYKGMASFEQVLSLAKSAMAQDKEGIRKEFVELVTRAAQITQVAKGN